MKKLLLIQPVNNKRKGLSQTHSNYPPLSLGIVAALTPDDWEVEIIDSTCSNYYNHEATLVGITAYTSTISHAYQIAVHYTARGIPVVMGGIHVSMLPEEALKFCTSVVIGEAEKTWQTVIKDFNSKNLKKVYTSGFCSSDEISSPRRELFGYSYNLSSIQASRGCPFNCDYCSVTKFSGNRMRLRKVEDIVKEWNEIFSEFVWFADDNLFGYSKKERIWAKNLFRELANNRQNKTWMCFAHINSLLDEEAVELAAASGCKLVYTGFESEDEEALISVNKDPGQIKTFSKVIDLLHKYGISILAGVMLGFDTDTPDKIDRRVDYLLENEIDSFFLSVVTPLPGTVFFEKMKQGNRLLYKDFPNDWENFDWTHLVFKPQRMSFTEADEAIHRAYEKAYSYSVIKDKYLLSKNNLGSSDYAFYNYLCNMDCRRIFLLEAGRFQKV